MNPTEILWKKYAVTLQINIGIPIAVSVERGQNDFFQGCNNLSQDVITNATDYSMSGFHLSR